MATLVTRRVLTALKSVSSPRCPIITLTQKRCISFSKCLSSRLFSEKHEWITIDDNVGTVGISNHAQDQLGEIVFVELPDVGAELQEDDMAGCLESVKAVSEVFSPVGGNVTEVNEALNDNPSLVNNSPLDDGWLYRMKVDSDVDTSKLMDEKAYDNFLKQSE